MHWDLSNLLKPPIISPVFLQYFLKTFHMYRSLPWWHKRWASIPGLERSPGEGHGNPSHDQAEPGGSQSTRVAESQTQLKGLSTHGLLSFHYCRLAVLFHDSVLCGMTANPFLFQGILIRTCCQPSLSKQVASKTSLSRIYHKRSSLLRAYHVILVYLHVSIYLNLYPYLMYIYMYI